MKRPKVVRIAAAMFALLVLAYGGYLAVTHVNFNGRYQVGQPIDALHGVAVYYNGGVNHTDGRSLAPDGYNFGLKYQCVEFVKRYYYHRYRHKMPDPWGHAKDFFDAALLDGEFNAARGLMQFANGGKTPPMVGDLVVFERSWLNPYGHVAIVSNVDANAIEIVQQNPGPFSLSRVMLPLEASTVAASGVVGWLRMPQGTPR